MGCDLDTFTLYARTVPDFVRYLFSSVKTMYVPDPTAYTNNEIWSQHAPVGQYAQIPDYDQYYRTHYD